MPGHWTVSPASFLVLMSCGEEFSLREGEGLNVLD